MKRLCAVLVLFAAVMYFSAGAVYADSHIPDLKGKWISKNYSHHHEKNGFFSRAGSKGAWEIKEQQGRLFYGERSYIMTHRNKKKVTEGFSGVISRDGKRIYMVAHNEDIMLGEILSDGTIEIVTMDDSEKDHHATIGLIEIERIK
ncbi:MAG: hypothetical protein K4571_09745 [Deltaproteobacteria bacterium]